MKYASIWLIAMTLTLSVGAYAVYEAEAEQQDAAALSSRDFAAQVICGPGKVAVWIDDKEHECLKEIK